MNKERAKAKVSIKYQRLLYVLMCVLVFEGIVRKLVPASIGQIVFFLKDFLCLYSLYLISKVKLNGLLNLLHTRWKILLYTLFPLLVYTAMLDFPLSIFAAKQYLLYVVVGLLVPMAFPQNEIEKFKRFSLFLALLVVPTTIVAILQNSLPSSHWLNLSVSGESLAAFSAGGYLRVSSTFSFTGQYSWFLNAVCAFVLLELFLPYFTKNVQNWLVAAGLGICFLIGIFITGGRTAVIGSAGCLFIGFILASIKLPSLITGKGGIAGAVMFGSLLILRILKPEFFAAYDQRSMGSGDVSHEEEVKGRILEGLTDWTTWFWVQEPTAILIGNGLGVMSNGADKVSVYANIIRSTGFWTEGDTATVAWEGGLYLLVAWYAFRLVVIAFCFKLWRSTKNIKYGIPASFLLANVIINGLIGTLSIQPPVAIWWWLSVGTIIALQGFDRNALNSSTVLTKRVSLEI